MSTLPHESAGATGAVPVITDLAGQSADEAIHAFEILADELGVARPSCADLRRLCGQIAQVTAELFPGDLAVKIGRDHEISNDVYLIFSVDATGSPDDISARSKQWHFRLHELAGNQAELFCLSFDVR